MATQAIKELIALLNVLCGGVIFLGLLVYLARARPRNTVVALALLAVVLLCLANGLIVAFLV